MVLSNDEHLAFRADCTWGGETSVPVVPFTVSLSCLPKSLLLLLLLHVLLLLLRLLVIISLILALRSVVSAAMASTTCPVALVKLGQQLLWDTVQHLLGEDAEQ